MRNIKSIYLKIAGLTIQLRFIPSRKKILKFFSDDSLYHNIINYLRPFIIEEKQRSTALVIFLYQDVPLFHKYIKNNISQSYIFFSEDKNNTIKTFQHISFSQFMNLLLIAIQKLLLKNNGFLLHAAGNNFHGKALIYTGPSGAGKSTAMTLLNDKYPSIADDSVIIRKLGNNYYCYQTPFIEKNGWVKKTKDKFKIDKIFFLKKNSVFKIEKITNKGYIFNNLIRQLWVDEIILQDQFTCIIDFFKKFNDFYFLHFNKNPKKLIELIDNFG